VTSKSLLFLRETSVLIMTTVHWWATPVHLPGVKYADLVTLTFEFLIVKGLSMRYFMGTTMSPSLNTLWQSIQLCRILHLCLYILIT